MKAIWLISKTVKNIAAEELDSDILGRVKKLRAIISQTAVDELDVNEFPFVNFRINSNKWIEYC